MVKQTIQIFCRIKPTKQPVGLYEVEEEVQNQSVVSFLVPRDLAAGFINNKKETYKFGFSKIFEQNTKQDEVFDAVAKPVIDNVISGFNGTIFAYGQTGSGKTFTITGGAERYIDRGIIPRCLSYVFDYFTKNAGHIHTAHVSYLEIYNDNGYDLLDPNHEATKLEDLPKISLLEDHDGNIHLKNLSLNQANTEEEALNLLFLGDTNRMIAETPMNQASTRSHCIFTIHITTRETNTATVRRSKLHLVDLAGSERVGKTGVGGTLLREAKYINLSLHMLEQVIIALSEKSRSHIPYRNSMMTSVLRDSLGGNCMTTMIATCSVEKKNVDESISTCRFAQRVALIKNDAFLNEELDPKMMIEKLKLEIQQLKDELSLAKGEQYESELTEEETNRLITLVQSFIEDKDEEAVLSVGADMRKINYCFTLLKKHCVNNNENVKNKEVGTARSSISATTSAAPHQSSDASYLSKTSEVEKLKDLILQRDNEINILVRMLKKEKERTSKINPNIRTSSTYNMQSYTDTSTSVNKPTLPKKTQIPPVVPDEELSPILKQADTRESTLMENFKHSKQMADMSIGRQEAFEIFKRDYKENGTIDENKKGLKRRYMDAKKLGEQVNNARQSINSIKSELEKIKSTKADIPHVEEKEIKLREHLDEEKRKYKSAFNQLKLLKTEIEHMQHLLEKSKVKLQKDFEIWWSEQSLNSNQSQTSIGNVRSAWKTPPLTPIDSTATKYMTSKSRNSSEVESRIAANFQGRSTPKLQTSTYSQNERNSSQEINHSEKSERELRTSRSLKNNTEQNMNFAINKDISLDSSINSIYSTRQSLESTRSSYSSNTNRSNTKKSSCSIPLTGDKKTDDDILAFMKARQELMRKSKHKSTS